MKDSFKILLVDDRPENLMALEAVLANPEYELVSATSGESALKFLLNDEFGLILLDVQMPGLNGFETAKIIRTRQKCQDIPIIFVTAISQTEENVLEGYASGAIDYIFKPYRPSILRAKVDAFLRMHKYRQELARQSELLKCQVKELDLMNEQLTTMTIELTRNEILLESMVEERTQRISNILESIQDAFFAVDTDYLFTYVNSAAEKIFSMPRQEILGKSVYEVLGYHPGFVKELVVITDMEPVHFEVICPHNDHCYEVRVFPAREGLSVYLTDVTERKLLDKEMARLDRLNLIGEMAAGIAHEIRNPMTTVRGFLQYASSGKAVLSPDNIEIMLEELDRANTIITEFLSLAKNKSTDKRLQNLSNVIESLLPLIKAEAILSGKAVVTAGDGSPDFYFDAKEIRQMILNLAMNGLEAMQAGGTLTLRVYEEEGDAVLAVQDEGSGIQPEIREKVGTPFFTTKDSGTGLGLAICYSIAARHKALIDIKSGDWGTAVYVRFKLNS